MEVELRNIYKSFGTNAVLQGVNVTLHSGEVHALMGENGAGKSTLMNILTGLHKQDKGEIFVDGVHELLSSKLINLWRHLHLLQMVQWISC